MAKGKYEYWLTEEGLEIAEGFKRRGLSDEKVAESMHVSYSTLREWMKRYPALSAVLKKGADEADVLVENSLFEAARRGNVTAQIFWLKNRRPDLWKDKPTANVNESDEQHTNLIDAIKGLADD